MYTKIGMSTVYMEKYFYLPLEKYTERMVSEMILAFNCLLRWFVNKSPCWPPLKYNVAKIVYSYFKLNSFRLICHHNKYGVNIVHFLWFRTKFYENEFFLWGMFQTFSINSIALFWSRATDEGFLYPKMIV